jgi:hypothetical protein
MQPIERLIWSAPHPGRFERKALTDCVDACTSCSVICTACADACLGDPAVATLRHCIRINLDCADVCGVLQRVLTRQYLADLRVLRALLAACAETCSVCATECERHARRDHCQACAEACRRCTEQCEALLREISIPVS